ncbi:MAG TPA: methyltransferase domain-containing protein [Thermoanaerobaculia bacterium]
MIDGIPILIAAIRGWLAANPLQILQRDDLSPTLSSLVGDALGPSSQFDTTRQHLSIYAFDHYESRSAQTLLDGVEASVDGPAIDIGCSVGGTTFALAARTRRLTVGVDLNFAMLRVAATALREQRVRYARRRVGLAYDDVELAVEANHLVDFWCCDAAAIPFADATFALAASLNVIDCVPSPATAIAELARVTAPGATAVITTPYDWAPTATPVEQWLGGHSQRGPQQGASEPVLRALLEDGGFSVEAEDDRPWRIRLHERSSVDYVVHRVVARRGER